MNQLHRCHRLRSPTYQYDGRFTNASSFAGSTVGFGGATQPAAIAWLRDEGYATIINLRLAAEEGNEVDESRTAAEQAGLRYVHLPLNPASPGPAIVDDFLAAVGSDSSQPLR